jgi:hypothetical protein
MSGERSSTQNNPPVPPTALAIALCRLAVGIFSCTEEEITLIRLWLKVRHPMPFRKSCLMSDITSGVFIFDTRSESWTEVSPVTVSNNDHRVECRTGHCFFATSVGVVFFGGLSGYNEAVSEVLLLDMFGKDSLGSSPLSTPAASRHVSANAYEEEKRSEEDMSGSCLPMSRNRSRSWSLGSGGSGERVRATRNSSGSGTIQSLLNMARHIFPTTGSFVLTDDSLNSMGSDDSQHSQHEYILQEEKHPS